MDKRIAMAVAVSAAAALPLLAACGGNAAPAASPAAPTTAAAAPSTTTVSTPSASASSSPSASASPSADPAKQTRAVQAATEKFLTTVLTVGYPDKTYDAYLARMKPLMTDDGYSELDASSKSSSAPKSLKKLYAARTRSTPKISGDVKVTKLEQARATSKVTFQNRVQQKVGGDYRTIKTSPKETATVSLVDEGGKWLVDTVR